MKKRGPIPTDKETLFFRHVEFQDDGCWLWVGAKKPKGYGVFTTRDKGRKITHNAHLYAYRESIGQVPAGLMLDHTCQNKACVNPIHLEPVTALINLLRGQCPNFVTSRTGICKRGHEQSDDNVYVHVNGTRHCKICATDRKHQLRCWKPTELTIPTPPNIFVGI